MHGSSQGIFAQIQKVAELILAKLHLLLLSKGNTIPDFDLHVEEHQRGLERESCRKAWLVLRGELGGLLLLAPGFYFPIN